MTEIFVITSNDLTSIETSSSSHSLKQRNHDSASQSKRGSDVVEIHPISLVDECHDNKEGNIEDDAISLSWFALAWFLTDVTLLFSKGAKYSNYQGSIPDEFLLR